MVMEIETKFIHSGYENDIDGSIIPSINLSTTYSNFSTIGDNMHEYIRCSNPTRNILENYIANSENGSYCISFSSGISAIQASLSIIDGEKRILRINDVYGGTSRLFKNIGMDIIEFIDDFVDLDKTEEIIKNNNINIIWIESPTNPLLKTININDISKIKHNSILIVDNTFATMYLQNPLLLGADIVVHSGTKYINGHSDVMIGFVICNNENFYNSIKKYQYQINGAVPSPFDCYMCIRGLKTLHIRMKRQSENSYEIYKFLLDKQQNGIIGNIYYPPEFKNGMHGGMISFELLKNKKHIIELPRKLNMIKVAESLGCVETLLNIPYFMTHACLSEGEKNKLGINYNLIRLSVGIENVNDILNDLKNIL